jgi:glycosyltransferase involved in cell wall biosynthesis
VIRLSQTRNRRYRVLIVATHAVQYSAPIYRQMARHPELDIEVAYCSLRGAESGLDPDFGKEVKWDVPLLDGYPWTLLRNRAIHPGPGRFFGFLNASLWRKVRRGRYDALVLCTGYRYATFWIGLLAAKLRRVPVLFGTDAISLAARDGAAWKAFLKRYFWPVLFRMADQVTVPSTGTREMMRALRIPERRITLTPYVVDNEWWKAQSSCVDRALVRARWDVPADAIVLLFCAKLQAWKRPLDLLRAFTKADAPNLFLVFAGDGPLHGEIAREAMELGVGGRVRLLGFVNQSELPAVYRASDVLVLPSEYEPFGVVVNEAILCGCVAAVSDHVGAGRDLIGAENGFVFPCGDVSALAGILRHIAGNAQRLKEMSKSSQIILEKWSPVQHIDAYVEALNRVAVARGVA